MYCTLFCFFTLSKAVPIDSKAFFSDSLTNITLSESPSALFI